MVAPSMHGRRAAGPLLLASAVAAALAVRSLISFEAEGVALIAASATEGAAPAPAPAPKPKAPGSAQGVVPLTVASALVFWRISKNQASISGKGTAAPEKPAKAPRIDAFDSMRFFLIFYIMCGHFISFAGPSVFAFKLVTQINVVVGAFFTLSGYVAAYTTTEIAEKKAKDKVVSTAPPAFIIPRIFGYWPLHLFVMLIFSPMFIYSDLTFSGPVITAWHTLMSLTMTSAWFPMHAEVWNAPTWFLGALTFATVIMPYALPYIAKQDKKALRRCAVWLTLFSLLPKIGYCYDNNAWGFLEGAMPPRAFPNLATFNAMRFCPVWAVLEVLLGVVGCRLVMLDGCDGEEKPKATLVDTLGPLVGMVAVIVLRATGHLALSDMLIRPLIFMPLFVLFLMGLHRASVVGKVTDPLAKILAAKPLTFMGGLSFPIFVVHGPLGQLFYKKIIAKAIFGGPCNVVYGTWFFYVYILVVIACAYLLQNYFMTSKKVGEWSKNMQAKVLKLC